MAKNLKIEDWTLSNGKTIKEIRRQVHNEIEKIYIDTWAKGHSVPYFDDKGNVFLANPDGSADAVVVSDNGHERYKIISRVAQPGHGVMSYLLKSK